MRVCLSRTDSIGDVILSLPMAGVIKEKIPEAKVIFLGKTYTKPIVQANQYIDEFINWDDMSAKEIRDIAQLLQEQKIDVFIHVFPNKKIAKAVKMAEIPSRIGTSRRLFHYLTCNRKVSFSRKKSLLHESQLNLNLLRPLIGEVSYEFKDLAKFGKLEPMKLPERLSKLIDKNKTNVIFHPKSQGSAVEWGSENFVDLAKSLPSEVEIFLTGTQAEGELMREAIIEPLKARAHDLTGQMSLEELISFIASCDGLVAASTGPLHIAGVTGVNAVGLFSNKRPIHPGRWGAIGKKARNILNPQWKSYDDPAIEIREIPVELVKSEILSWKKS
jgi:heptosyltransferase-3